MYKCSAGNEEDRFGFRREVEANFGIYLLELKIDQFTNSEYTRSA